MKEKVVGFKIIDDTRCVCGVFFVNKRIIERRNITRNIPPKFLENFSPSKKKCVRCNIFSSFFFAFFSLLHNNFVFFQIMQSNSRPSEIRYIPAQRMRRGICRL